MTRLFVLFVWAIQALTLQAQADYWGIEFTLSDPKNHSGYSNYADYEAAFRQGEDAQDNGFAGIPIHFDIDSRKYIYTDEGGLSSNRMLLQIHKISTQEEMSIFFQLEPKCLGICMIDFRRIPFQSGTYQIEANDITYNPIMVNPANTWEDKRVHSSASLASISENDAAPKSITEIPYYANPASNTPPPLIAQTETVAISQPVMRKSAHNLPAASQKIELATSLKGEASFLIKCSTPNRLEKPMATIFEFNTDYNQVIIEFMDIPHEGASVSPLSKEILIPNIPHKTYNLIILYNNIRSVGKLIYTGNSLEIQVENSENVVVTNGSSHQ